MKPLRLGDAATLRRDGGGRTPAYFATAGVSLADRDVLEDLKEELVRSSAPRTRICLHGGPDSLLHEMLIAEKARSYTPPHRHENLPKSYEAIEGELLLVFFGKDQRPTGHALLAPEGTFAARIEPGQTHMPVPMSAVTVFKETRPGPFPREGADVVRMAGAPGAEDEVAARAFVDRILGVLGLR